MTGLGGSGRAGMSLVELMVALTIFGVVITTAVGFMAQQNSAYSVSVERISALRNLRYAATLMAQDLETLGTNVPDGQPPLYYADEDVVVFAADHTTNVASDPFAVFHDPDAPGGQVGAPLSGFSLPNAGLSWPDTLYESVPGVTSPAEVIIFFFRPDSTTDRTDDWVLFRQVNSGSREEVSRNLLQIDDAPFLSYERLATVGGVSAPAVVPDSLVPIHHAAEIHLSVADTGRFALADSVRAVRLRIRATNGRTGEDEVRVELDRLIPLPNTGLGQLATCGSAPILGVGLTATAGTTATGDPAGLLSWTPAVDESGGEGDVVRYMIWRREVGDPSWGDPYLAIPAGASSYSYEDADVDAGTIYQYALAAQDCTPTLSTLQSSGPVSIS